MQNKYKIAIIGGAGYTGLELLRLLQNHPFMEVVAISSDAYLQKSLGEVFPQFGFHYSLKFVSHQVAVESGADLFFLATPNDVSLALAPMLVEKGAKVVDLAGSFRLADAGLFAKHYKLTHPGEKWIESRVFGLPELYREKIKGHNFIANPGCYPTAALLPLIYLAPWLDKLSAPVFIDAKSGVSGAGGRVTTPGMGFVDVNESFKAYKVLNHQHEPEIGEQLGLIARQSVPVHFVPHLVPMNRGILATIWLYFNEEMDLAQMRQDISKAVEAEPFVRFLPAGESVRTAAVSYTNQCHFQVDIAPDKRVVVVTSAIDNLGKGAAGQALQNANLMLQLPETMALS